MISKKEYEILYEVQQLPLIPKPFQEIATRLGIEEEELIRICEKLKGEKKIRRFSASVAHRRLGFSSNPMTAVNVPKERIDMVGEMIAKEPDVTHCYSRTGFDYNIFFIIHGKKRDEAVKRVERIVEKTGISDFKVYFSTHEYKKTSFKLKRKSN